MLEMAFDTDAPEFSTKFCTTVVIKSRKDHTVLLHNANLGPIGQYLMSSQHSNKALIEDGGFTQNKYT